MSKIPPKVDRVKLDGYTFGLDAQGASFGEIVHRQSPQKRFQVEGDGGEFWKEWTMRSFHGGERLERVLAPEDLQTFRYHDAEGLDQALLSKWGELKLASSATRSLAIQSPSLPMTVTSDGVTLIVGLDESPFIKLWTSAGAWANATSVAGSGTVTDLITAGTTLYGVRGGGVITSTDSGANWSAVGAYTTAVGVASVNGDLYVGKSDGVYNHTDSETVSTLACTVIAGYRENVYFGKDRRLYRWDGRAAYLYDEFPQGFNLTALIPYRQVLLCLGYFKVRSGYRGAVYYLISGSENHLYSLGDYSADHRIYACAGSDDEIFFANPKRGGVDRYDLEVSGITNGPIWGAAGNIPFKSIAVCEGYCFIGRYDNASGTDGVWIADIANPTAWKTTGWLKTAEYDFEWSNDAKLFGSIYVEHRALVQGESITVEYSVDGGTTYTSLGTSAIAGATSKTFTLDNVVGLTIKLRLTLTGPGTSTPTLTKCVVRAAAITDKSWTWDLKLLVMEDWGGRASIDHLKESNDKQSQLDFVDIDEQEYKVVIDQLAIDSLPSKDHSRGGIQIRLRQV